MNLLYPKKQITGLILSGGQGKRMNGLDKGLQRFRDAPLVSHVLSALKPQAGSVMISANRNLDRYKQFDAKLISDEISGFAGPLAGIHSGLLSCKTPYLLVAPCDTPFLPKNLGECLYEVMSKNDSSIAVAKTMGNNMEEEQPVFCLIKTTLLENLESYLANGERKVRKWQKSLNPSYAFFEDNKNFLNFNTLEELNSFE